MVNYGFRYVFTLYSVEFYAMSQNSLWYMCVSLREKKNRFSNLSHTHKWIGTYYLLICVFLNIQFLCTLWRLRVRICIQIILCEHLCSVSQFFMMTQNNKIDCWKHTLAYSYSKFDYMWRVSTSNTFFWIHFRFIVSSVYHYL